MFKKNIKSLSALITAIMIMTSFQLPVFAEEGNTEVETTSETEIKLDSSKPLSPEEEPKIREGESQEDFLKRVEAFKNKMAEKKEAMMEKREELKNENMEKKDELYMKREAMRKQMFERAKGVLQDGTFPAFSKPVNRANLLELFKKEVQDNDDDASVHFLIDQAADDLLVELEGKTEEEVASLIQKIEKEIQSEVENSENKDSEKMRKKVMRLKQLLQKIRTKAVEKNAKLATRFNQAKKQRGMYEIRWGELNKKREACKDGVTTEELESALAENKVPEKCENDSNKVEYKGSLAVNTGQIKVVRQVLFENNDSVTTDTGSKVEWNSFINGHWDGLVLSYTPEQEGDNGKEGMITISIGDLNETYDIKSVFGRKNIGNGHFIEVKHLGGDFSGINEKFREKIIANKVKTQEKLGKLQDKIERLRLMGQGGEGIDELEKLLEEVAEYNFDETTNGEVDAEIDAVEEGLSDDVKEEEVKNKVDRLKEKIKELKEKAKGRKFNEGMIPFKDTDDGAWYTSFVGKAKARGIIGGYKNKQGQPTGEFGPSNDLRIGEILKISLETSGQGEEEGEVNPQLKAALDNWSKKYVRRAESLELNVVSETDLDLNRPATRGEVIRMMLESLGIDPEEVSATDFSDVPKNHKHARFIQYAKKLGIISGDAGKTTFRPDEPINRAEAAKISDQITEVLVGDVEEVK